MRGRKRHDLRFRQHGGIKIELLAQKFIEVRRDTNVVAGVHKNKSPAPDIFGDIVAAGLIGDTADVLGKEKGIFAELSAKKLKRPLGLEIFVETVTTPT